MVVFLSSWLSPTNLCCSTCSSKTSWRLSMMQRTLRPVRGRLRRIHARVKWSPTSLCRCANPAKKRENHRSMIFSQTNTLTCTVFQKSSFSWTNTIKWLWRCRGLISSSSQMSQSLFWNLGSAWVHGISDSANAAGVLYCHCGLLRLLVLF